MVAPAKVMHDDTDPIHAVTELNSASVGEWLEHLTKEAYIGYCERMLLW